MIMFTILMIKSVWKIKIKTILNLRKARTIKNRSKNREKVKRRENYNVNKRKIRKTL